MVGFTIPLTMFGTAAAKSFMEIEKQILKIQRVYGDFSTTVEETKAMTDQIRTLAQEYTKYGVAVTDTLNLAADAAAAGKTGQELLSQISEATRLAVLGNVEQTQALETTMSITNAFGTAAEDLAGKIDFLNAVENQSVTSIEDLTEAIPKAGPVVQQLGGDVEDLAFFLTAMKEGGINASEGANALKSGLASLINPTGKAKEMLQGFGINIEKIVESNKGDIKGLVIDFASALDTLDPLSRARAIEQLFGKFQFSRLSTLFQNVIKDGTQAQRVLELSNATTQELAILSKRELAKIEQTTTYKFEKAFADFQAAIAPVGEEFLKLITPVIEFGTKLLQQFNNMDAGVKQFVVGLTGLLGIVFPALLMTIGLFANGIANILKLVSAVSMMFRRTSGDAGILGTQFEYMTQAEIQAAAAAASLDQVHSKLRQTFTAEKAAVDALTTAYQRNIAAQKGAITGGASTRRAKPAKYAKGVVSVPGPKGAGDVVPAMLAPGEAVIPAKMAKKYGGLISGMVAGNIPGYEYGFDPNERTVETHLQGASSVVKGGPGYSPALAGQLLEKVKIAEDVLPKTEALGQLVAKLPNSLNENLKRGGVQLTQFSKAWTHYGDKLDATLAKGLKSIGSSISPNSPEMRKNLKAVDKAILANVKTLAAKNGGMVTDALLAQATRQALASEIKNGNVAATALSQQANTLREYRTKYSKEDLLKNIQSGRFKLSTTSTGGGQIIDPKTGMVVGRVGSRGGMSSQQQMQKYASLKTKKEKEAFLQQMGLRQTSRFTSGRQQSGAIAPALTPAQKAAETRRRNAQLKADQASQAQAKRDEINARRRERYAAKKEAERLATQPAPKKPGIGSRIASGVRGMGGMGAGMGLAMAGGAMAMVPGLEGLGGALAMIGPLFMMLPAPVAGVVAGLGAMVGIIMSANNAIEMNRKKVIEAADANSINNQALKQLAEDVGAVSPTETAAQARDASLLNTTAATLTAGEQLLANSAGAQQILEGARTQLQNTEDATKTGETLGRTLSTAVLEGILSQTDAASLATAIGYKLGNINIAEIAASQVVGLTGNLSTDLESLLLGNQGTATEYGMIKQRVANSESDTIGRNTLYTTAQQATADMAKPEITGLAVEEMNRYADSVKLADIAIADLSLSEEERQRALELTKETQNQALASISEYASKLSSDEFDQVIRTKVEAVFPDDPDAQTALKLLEDTEIADKEFKLMVQSQFASGAISPAMVTYLVNSSKDNKALQEVYRLTLETNGFQAGFSKIALMRSRLMALAQTAKSVIEYIITANNISRGETGPLLVSANLPPLFTNDGTGDYNGGDNNDNNGTSGGGSGEDATLTRLNKERDKVQKALNVVALKEDAINKKYDKRKKALEDIAKINANIADQQKGQLDLADALARGDIAAAARAIQTERNRAAAYAEEQQQKALEAKRQAELDGIIVNGKTKEAYEAEIAKLNLKIAERELELALGSSSSGGSGGSGGGSGSGSSSGNTSGNTGNTGNTGGTTPTAKPTNSAGIGKKWVWSSVINQWVATAVPKPKSPSEVGVKWEWSTPQEKWYKYTVPKPGPTYTWDNTRDVWNAPSGGGPVMVASGGFIKYAMGGKVASYFSRGGKALGSDTIPAMLTPGEFVVKRPAVQGFGVKNLEAINNGNASGLGSVYNYSVTVNASGTTNADELARVVVGKIKEIDRYRIRGVVK
jgi:TP901 family phage tail tape measure protein